MPYLNFKTTLKLSAEQKRELSADIMDAVKYLPGKPAVRAMIHIEDSCEIYRDGQLAECAFMQTIFQRPIDLEDQKRFVEALYALFKDKLGLDTPQVYFAMVDLDTWGSRGTLH